MFLFLITFYLYGTDTALPPNKSKSVFLENIPALQFRNIVPRSQASLFQPGHRLKPVHSFYVGLKPYEFPKSQSKQNIYLANPALPGDVHFSVSGSLQGVKADRTHLFWPPEVISLSRIRVTKDKPFFPTFQYPFTHLTADQTRTPSTQNNFHNDITPSPQPGMTATGSPNVPSDPPMALTDPPMAPIDPMAPTDPPMEPSHPPMAPIDPMAPTDPPMEQSHPAMAPTDYPMPPSDPSMESSHPPMAPTDHPIESVDRPIPPSDASMAPSDPPIAQTDPPMAPPHLTTEPTDLTMATEDPTMASTNPTILHTNPTMTYMFQTRTTSKHMVYLGYSRETASTAELFHVDEKGFHYVSIPTKLLATTVFYPARPVKTLWFPTTEDIDNGEIKQKSVECPKQRYLDKMDELKEGYMVIFLLEFTKQVSLKEEKYLKEILIHTEAIYNRIRDSGRIEWVVDPLQAAAWKVSVILSNVNKIENLRTYSSMMFHMLMQRKKVLSDEINSIIDEADLFYNDDEGDRLFSALIEFEQYPTNTSKTGYYLCDSFIQSLLRPFRRLSGSLRRKRLLDKVNRALKSRFPELSKRKHNHTHYEGNMGPGSKKKQYESADERNHKRMVRLQHELYKLGYTNKSIYVRHYSIGYKNSMLRTMIDQARFRATGSVLLNPPVRPTSSYISKLVTKPSLGVFERNEEPGFKQTPPEKDTLNLKYEGVFRSDQ